MCSTGANGGRREEEEEHEGRGKQLEKDKDLEEVLGAASGGDEETQVVH